MVERYQFLNELKLICLYIVKWFQMAPAYGRAKAGRPARTYIQHVRIRDVALNTCQGAMDDRDRW